MKLFVNSVHYLLIVWPVGILLGILFKLGQFLRIVRVKGFDNFQKSESKMLLVSNHPSLVEPFALIALFFPQYLFHPFRFGPWNLPDSKNFGGIFRLFSARLIPVERGNRKQELKAIYRAAEMLNINNPVIIFPEGGRTESGGNCERLQSATGNRMRRFKNGVGLLALKTNALVQPVWVKGTDKIMPRARKRLFSFPRFWKPFEIRIGVPMRFSLRLTTDEVTKYIEAAVFRLADGE